MDPTAPSHSRNLSTEATSGSSENPAEAKSKGSDASAAAPTTNAPTTSFHVEDFVKSIQDDYNKKVDASNDVAEAEKAHKEAVSQTIQKVDEALGDNTKTTSDGSLAGDTTSKIDDAK